MYVNLDHLVVPFVDALIREITFVGERNPGLLVHSIYFGGGTPTLLTIAQFERIVGALRESFAVLPDAEISTEANPNDLMDHDYLEGLHQMGIERLSIGVQSVLQSELEMFGRLHDADMVAQAVENARAVGYDNINLDLIYGNPNQTMTMWQHTMEAVLVLQPDHFSLYALGIEPKTAMEYWIDNGKLHEPDGDLAADMYEWASGRLAAAGYGQYEISNWAKPGYESQHNMQYWRNLPYLGLGPGAHGYAGGKRYQTVRAPRRYIEALQGTSEDAAFPITPAVEHAVDVSREDEIAETIMMGMRLLQEGISLSRFEARFGVSLLKLRGDVIAEFEAQGVIERTHDTLRLTPAGRFVSNRILRDLI